MQFIYDFNQFRYCAFAQLYEEGLRIGCQIPANFARHPGLYYYKAADYIVKRREAFNLARSERPENNSISPASTPTLQMFSTVSDFFGTRSSTCGKLASEQEIITISMDSENKYNHSNAIVHCLGLAMNQYKHYGCLRFKKMITIEIAKEYQSSGDHEKALT